LWSIVTTSTKKINMSTYFKNTVVRLHVIYAHTSNFVSIGNIRLQKLEI